MMMKNIKYLFFVLLLPFLCFGQDETAVNDINELNTIIVPPTPEVASLGKFIETPVNEFTGIPKIQVPIYSIKQGRIKHDIGLSYHAQGVKVEEIASRVGMGWTLNAGGMIHRQMRGRPDEGSFGYLGAGDVESRSIETFGNSINQPADCETIEYVLDLFNYSYPHKVDYEPDLFSFSFGGYSGRFYFDQVTKQPMIEESSPLRVERVASGFKITTPDGLEYYFGTNRNNTDSARVYQGGEKIGHISSTGKFGKEVNQDDYNDYPTYVGTWHLMEIYDPTRDSSVTFQYNSLDVYMTQRLSSSVIAEELTFLLRSTISYKEQYSRGVETEYVLDKINFENGHIIFEDNSENTNNDRLDLAGTYSLNQIDVLNQNGKFTKSFGLDYFYSESKSNAFTSSSKRLFLSGIKEYEIDNSSNSIIKDNYKTYSFDYKNPDDLPSRFSTAQDFWGFHNGKSSNENLMPLEFMPLVDGLVRVGTANRHVNGDYAQDGVLTKVTYPTGGSATYIYESNRAKKNIATDNSVESRNSVITQSNFEEFRYNFGHSFNNVEHIEDDESPQYIMYFQVDGSRQTIEINYENHDTSNAYNWITNIQKVGENSQTSGRIPNVSLDNGIQLQQGRRDYTLEPGTYRILLYWDSEQGENEYKYYDARDSWSINFEVYNIIELDDEENDEGFILTGGLRVKEVVTDDLKGNINSTTYLYEDESGNTTGNLVSIPYRLKDVWSYFDVNSSPRGVRNTTYREYAAISNIPLATTSGSYTGYDKVTKINEDGDNGKEEFFFSFSRNKANFSTVYGRLTANSTNSESYALAPIPLLNEEMQRGKLLSKISYNAVGSIAQKTTNKYELNTYKEILGYSMRKWGEPGVVRALASPVFGPGDLEDVVFLECNGIAGIINRYSLLSRSNLLQEQESTVYDSNGENPVTTTTNYNYENATFPSLQTSSITTNSKDDVIENKTYYPDDVDGTTVLEGGVLSTPEFSAIQRLTSGGDEFRVGQPIQQETYVNNILTSVQRTNFSTENNITLPVSVATAIDNDNVEERLTYHSYDSKGNPEEVSKKEALHSVYIWGYNQTYPVVKVDNATITAVEAILSTAELNNVRAGSYNDSQMRSVLNKIRTGLPNSMVTIYTYDLLVGITSVTDPKGYTMYYEYDGFQRLISVKDSDGNLVSTNEYNYK